MTFGSLFAGIGGLDLGLERAGMVCKWQVEIDDYATRVLERHWPDVRRWRDVKTFPPDADGERCEDTSERQAKMAEPSSGNKSTEGWVVDLICGGFPCQDISYAGRGAGLEGDRSGLFFEALRVVRQLRPRYVLLENVAALLTRGLDRVHGELASIGYGSESHCIPAAAVGAPHIRDRVFVLAYAQCNGSGSWRTECERQQRSPAPIITGSDVADANDAGSGAPRSGTNRQRSTEENAEQSQSQFEPCRHGPEVTTEWWSTEPGVGRNADGFPNFLDRHIGRGLSYAESQRAVEGLRSVWSDHVAKAVERTLGGLDRIQAAAVLFALMCEYAKGGRLPRQFVAGTEALGEELRYLRGREHARCTSQGHEPIKQFSGECPDVVRDVSCEIASWNTFEGGIARVATGVPARVDRLRCLGNAVVPQVAEWIGRHIIEIDIRESQ